MNAPMSLAKPRLGKLESLEKILWAAALVTLPVTSFRWFPFLGEGTLVRPLALYPLAALLPLLVIRAIRRERSFPLSGSLVLLGVFALAALAVTALGALIAPIPLRGQDYSERALRAVVTLAIGLVFFLAAAWMNRNETDVRFTIRWLLVGLGLDRFAGGDVLYSSPQEGDGHALAVGLLRARAGAHEPCLRPGI